MEGMLNLEQILYSDCLFYYFSSRMCSDLAQWVGLASVDLQAARPQFSLAEESTGDTSLNLISQFFWMKEQKRFLILFSGLPGRLLEISDHLLPTLLQSSNIRLSSSSDQSSRLILGSNLLMYLSLICLPFLEPSISEMSFQFLPYFLISLRMVQSSWADHILWLWPSCTSLRQRCRHWFSLRSVISQAISDHFLGRRSQSSKS